MDVEQTSPWRMVLTGAAIGLAWGVSMRLWMRYISTDPEFSWSGTLFIIGASVIVGSLLGFARHRRRIGGVGWWRYTGLSLFLLGAGGGVMWPSVILGAVALGRPRPRWLRLISGLGAIALQIPVMQDVAITNFRLSVLESVVAILWYAPMIALEAWGFSVVVAPRSVTAAAPGMVKKLAIAGPLVIVVGATAVLTGGILGM